MEPWIELALLTVAAVRVGAVLALPAARREVARSRWLAAMVALGAVGAVASVAWIAATHVALLRVLTIAVVAIWALLAWRATPTFGRRRGWPPGSLGLRHSLRAIVDPEFYAAEGRRHGPVFKMAQFHQPVACVIGLDRGRRILREYPDALTPPPLPLSAAVPRGFLRYMTTADHERYVPLFRAAFSDGVFSAAENAAVGDVDRAFAALARASTSADGAGVDPRPILQRHLLDVLLRLFFGGLLRPEDRALIEASAHDADVVNAVGRPSPAAIEAVRRFERLITERSAAYDAVDDPSVWGALSRLDPDALHDDTVVGNLFLMLLAAWESVGGIVAWSVQMLGSVPEWVRSVQAGPSAPGDDPIGRAVTEALRLAQSEYVYRRVLRSIDVDGFVVPRGWFLRVCVAESHRMDPPFARPDVFDPDRHLGRRFSANELSPFGFDEHACLGARLTVLICSLFVRRLLRGYTCTIVADGPRERGNRHWNHWRPSARLRIAIAPRPGAAP